MRVLSIGSLYPPHHFGGAELTWRAAVAALRRYGHDVRVLVSDHQHPAGPLGGAEEDPDVHRELRWYWRHGDWPRIGRAERVRIERHNARVLHRHLTQFRPDAVLWAEMGGMSLSLIEQVRRAGLPALGLVLDEWMAYGPTVDAWTRGWRTRPRRGAVAERLTGVPTRVAYAEAATWAFNSAFLRDRTSRRLGYDLPRTLVLHSPVDTALFAPRAPAPWRGELAYVGRVVEEKGIAVVIEAVAGLPRARLTITGPGDPGFLAGLQAQAARLGVEDRVRFVPAAGRDDLAGVYADADAVVFPVLWEEPWGKVPLEAMAVGRPAIATATGGAREYLRHEHNALVIEPDSAQAVIDAVRRLADDERLRARLVAAGHTTSARFSEEAYGAALVNALHDVVQDAEGSPPRPSRDHATTTMMSVLPARFRHRRRPGLTPERTRHG